MLVGSRVDRAIVGHNPEAKLLVVSAALFLVQILSWINANAMQFQTGRTAEQLLFALRTRTFAHLSWLSLDYYDRELGGPNHDAHDHRHRGICAAPAARLCSRPSSVCSAVVVCSRCCW